MHKSMLSIGLWFGSLASFGNAGEMGETAPVNTVQGPALFDGSLPAGQYAALKASLQQKAAAEITKVREKQILAHRAADKVGFLESLRQENEIVRQFLLDQKKLDARFANDGNLVDRIKLGLSQRDILTEIEKQRLGTTRQETLDRLRGEGKVDQNGRAISETSAERTGKQLAVNRELAKARNAAQTQFREDLRATRNPPPRRFTASGKEIQRPARPTRNPFTGQPVSRKASAKPIAGTEIENAVNDLTKRTIDQARQSGTVSNETAAALKAAADSQRQTANQIAENKEAVRKLAEKLKEAQVLARKR